MNSVSYQSSNVTVFVSASPEWKNFAYHVELVMVGDADVLDSDFHCLFDFIIRRCHTDAKVFRRSFIIHNNTWEAYRARVFDLRILISDVAATFFFSVYIRGSIIDVTAETTNSRLRPHP